MMRLGIVTPYAVQPAFEVLSHRLCRLQVKTSILKSGKKIDNDIVVVGVGAKPNTEMFKGQLDFLEERPGGIKVHLSRLAINVTTEMRTRALILRA